MSFKINHNFFSLELFSTQIQLLKTNGQIPSSIPPIPEMTASVNVTKSNFYEDFEPRRNHDYGAIGEPSKKGASDSFPSEDLFTTRDIFAELSETFS